MASSVYRRKIVELRFAEQDGKCFYCQCACILLPPEEKIALAGKFPANMATYEHVRDRYHPERRERGVRNVMACFSCNQERGQARQRALGTNESCRTGRAWTHG